MSSSPTQYIMWRFAANDDKESLEFKSDELSVHEATARDVLGALMQVRHAIGNLRHEHCLSALEQAVKVMTQPQPRRQ